MFQKSVTAWILPFILFTSQISAASFGDVPDPEVLREIAPGSSHLFSTKLSIMTWNVKKGEAGNQWAQDIQQLSSGKSLILLQEGMEDDFMTGVLRAIPSLGWFLARSFFMDTDRNATGVITGSPQTPFSSAFLRSRDVEPIIRTPKMTLLTTYQMEDGSRLMVVNIHAINFTTPGPFYRQIDDIMAVLQKWEGRILFGGDFNTWISARIEYLKKKATALGLKHVAFGNDPRGMKLDHLFVRGCSPYAAEVRSDIVSSDHFPLTTELLCVDEFAEMMVHASNF